MTTISLTTQLTKKDYIDANLYVYKSRWFSKFILGLGILILIASIPSFFVETEIPWQGFVVALFMIIGMPGVIYFNAAKGYNAQSRISEKISYDLNKEKLIITGESFVNTLDWNKVHGITESKDFIIIWQTTNTVSILPKRDIKEGNIHNLKVMIEQYPNIKSKFIN